MRIFSFDLNGKFEKDFYEALLKFNILDRELYLKLVKEELEKEGWVFW